MRIATLALLLLPAVGWSAPAGVVEVTMSAHKCGTCGMPPGENQPIANRKVDLLRDGKFVATLTTDKRGRASKSLAPGMYCVDARSSPVAAPICGKLRAGETLELHVDLSACEPLHCSGREP